MSWLSVSPQLVGVVGLKVEEMRVFLFFLVGREHPNGSHGKEQMSRQS